MDKKILNYKCEECGSTDLSIQGRLEWNVEQQKFIYDHEITEKWCGECAQETTIVPVYDSTIVEDIYQAQKAYGLNNGKMPNALFLTQQHLKELKDLKSLVTLRDEDRSFYGLHVCGMQVFENLNYNAPLSVGYVEGI